MKLQIALDDITLEDALVLVGKVRDYIDIIEIGTPFVYEYGMQAVRTMKEHFPDKEVLADMKIMDAGFYEAEEALKAGADYVTVLGVTDNLTIQGCKEAAEKYGKEIVVDMICVDNMEERIAKLEELGVHGLAVHTGTDQQAAGRTPLDDLKVMAAASQISQDFCSRRYPRRYSERLCSIQTRCTDRRRRYLPRRRSGSSSKGNLHAA